MFTYQIYMEVRMMRKVVNTTNPIPKAQYNLSSKFVINFTMNS